ncbi:serine/threonine-protein kinase [Luteolibacter sp. GHJ8]|uniref:Serine/threonine-protein kinase n=1 Tax=Luteolibacter rhizosphaerae TaxID=2989719 RepID=A0ABT3G172_9BACT|nr:serine/threonine-protein kinase [Luteolibacter rhizosphaerae]MCW1913575.1 serine/threonine-protein kinase [Luteolibacter rhizosphaerae]
MPDESDTSKQPRPLTGEHAAALLDLGFGTMTPEPGTPDQECEDKPGDLIGRYRLVEPLGEGGFGYVWSAEQIEPIHRAIALKLIRRGMDSREIVARFAAESQALALMDHPNIAAVFDAGTTADGRPFFAMELVKGEPLTSYCDSRSLGLRERLELFIPVCQAVQHAHQKAILHRDLKPSNIIVTEVDGKPVPKVIDFGIAKALGATPEAALDASLLYTRAGAILGTLQYMSPEQAGSVSDVDTRSDVYSLGVILYELLTGVTPLAAAPRREAYDETLRRIRTEEAPRPSTVARPETTTIRGTEGSRLRRALRGDLDWITVKALEKDRRRRYETATAFATDLRRYLDREPVSAAAPTWSYQFSKFARRNRVVFISTGVVAVALVTATAVSLKQAAIAKRESHKAEANALQAEQNLALAVENQDRARAAVDAFLNEITEDPRLHEADFIHLRSELLEKALPFYEELSAENTPGGKTTKERATALNRLGLLYHELGQPEKAVASYQRQIAVVEELIRTAAPGVDYRDSQLAGYNNMAASLGALKRTSEALEAQKRSLEIIRNLVRDYPESKEHRNTMITLMVNLAQMLALQDIDRKGGIALMGEALEEAKQLSREYPDNEVVKKQLAYVHSNYAVALHTANDPVAEEHFRIARDLQDRWIRDHPGDQIQRELLATTTFNLGHLLSSRGRYEEALAMLRESAAHSDLLAIQVPSAPEHTASGAKCRTVIGLCLFRLDRSWEAEPELKIAVEVHHRLSQQFPTNPDYPGREAVTLDVLAAIKRRNREWAAARSYYEQSIACHLHSRTLGMAELSDHNFHAERLDSLSQMAIEQGDLELAVTEALKIPETGARGWLESQGAALLVAKVFVADLSLKNQEQAERHAAQAIALLQQAVDRGSPNLPDYGANEPFSFLRDYPAFRNLKEAAPDPEGKSPSRFIFDYQADDPGPRHWKRTGDIWVETKPSGTTTEFRVGERMRHRNLSGTIITNTENKEMQLFVPDKGETGPPQLRMKFPPGKWESLGEIRDVE